MKKSKLQLSKCCMAPALPIAKATGGVWKCAKCGAECGVTVADAPFVHTKGIKKR